eukprot:TRINITY_DN2889_c0_g1_i1.p1 TRINITY_DN2889_c0_g1~~TRINITY_DN2889_c0_g1_i1.p1  ORF type:complete len:219 (+),score=40.35 TRINITY_DN2889_c0_g1_i1:171-827(+)
MSYKMGPWQKRVFTMVIVFLSVGIIGSYLIFSRLLDKQPPSSPGPSSLSSSAVVGLTNLEPPVSREEIGRATWALLHTIAAQYPERPTSQQQENMKNFILSLADIYPCRTCAKGWQMYIKKHGVSVGSHRELAEWLCNCHNVVNKRNDKPLFDCSTIDQHWPAKLKTSCGCDDEDGDASSSSSGGAQVNPQTYSTPPVSTPQPQLSSITTSPPLASTS